MPWMPGAFSRGTLTFHRTPPVKGKVPHIMEPCSEEQFSAVLDMIEMNGREPLDIDTLRVILGKKAFMGEAE